MPGEPLCRAFRSDRICVVVVPRKGVKLSLCFRHKIGNGDGVSKHNEEWKIDDTEFGLCLEEWRESCGEA